MLQTPGIAAIATTTLEEYDKEIKPLDGGGLAGRFKEKIVKPVSDPALLLQLLKKAWKPIGRKHGVKDLPDEEFEDFIAHLDRYSSPLSQPGRGKRALDYMAARAAAEGRDTANETDKVFAIAELTGLEKEFVAMGDYERIIGLNDSLCETIRGQDLEMIADRLAGARGGLSDSNKMAGAFLFVGPTGTGKTETAKQLARKLFGTEDALARIDMSEYQEEHSVSGLIGTKPGYVGYDDDGGALYGPVRERPGGLVLLLDEVEKGHPKVFDVLLRVLDDGKGTDNKGREVDFRNVVLIMTANLGTQEAAFVMARKGTGRMGFTAAAEKEPEKDVTKIFEAAPKKHFRPEFVARVEALGGVVVFRSLTRDVIAELTAVELAATNKRLVSPPLSLKGVKIELADAAMAQLVQEGFDPVYNARPVKSAVNRRVNDPVGRWLLDPKNKAQVQAFAKANGGARLVIDALGKNVVPRLEPPAPAPVAAPTANDNPSAPPLKSKFSP